MRNGEISQRLEGGILFNGDNAVRRTQSGVGIEGQRAAFDIDAVLAVLPGEGERAGAKLVQRAVARNDARKRHIMAIGVNRSEAHTSELQSLMRISYAVFC